MAKRRPPSPSVRLGETVILSAPSTASENALRNVAFTVGGVSLEATLVDRVDGVDRDDDAGLIASFDAWGIAANARLQAIHALMDTVRPLFSLDGDARFAAIMRKALEELSIGEIGVRLEALEGTPHAVAAVTAQARFKGGELVVGFGARLRLARLSGSFPFLAARRDDEQLVVLDFEDSVDPDAVYYLVGQRAVLAMRASATVSANAAAFIRRNDGADADFSRLLAWGCADAPPSLTRLLRQRPPQPFLHEPALGVRFEIECAAPLAHGTFVAGWFDDPEERIERAVVVDHGLDDPDLIATWRRFPVLLDAGGGKRAVTRFCAFLRRRQDAASAPPTVELRLDLATGESHLLRAALQPLVDLGLRDAILNTIIAAGLDADMLETVYRPAIALLQAGINARQSILRTETFGRRSRRDVSIIVPLYREIGFLRSQLSAFSVDPFIREHAEIIFVVDDPTIVSLVSAYCEGATIAFPLDLRVAVMARNGGYALANNFGAAIAEGETLALLNSDVIPERSGWLEAARAKLETQPDFSVVGARLLYGDGTLQHAGMYFDRLSTGFWQNFHYWKGYGRFHPPSQTEQVVPAVTGACMILRRRDFLDVGGFTADFVVGDYEDSDLCLKLRARGGASLYAPAIELRHYERQSMPQDADNVDRGSTQYNRALHTLKWDAIIREIMSDVS
jgi:GT2 family glycosyltransferase